LQAICHKLHTHNLKLQWQFQSLVIRSFFTSPNIN
jgi:hypothetical protein